MYFRHWLMQSEKLRSPTICHLQAKNRESQQVIGISMSLKTHHLGVPMSEGRRRWLSQIKNRERLCSSFAILPHLGPQWITQQ